jgi:hypothetical protein
MTPAMVVPVLVVFGGGMPFDSRIWLLHRISFLAAVCVPLKEAKVKAAALLLHRQCHLWIIETRSPPTQPYLFQLVCVLSTNKNH